jgi:hypothetical protein
MLTQLVVTQALGLFLVNARKKADAEYCTHLAVNFGRDVETDQDINYDREAGQARHGINLSKGKIQTMIGRLEVRPYRNIPISSIDMVDVLGRRSTRSEEW